MKIRSLAIENFRRFREPMRLDGLTDGLNLICEPNESGKSTVLEAMRAALFERHGAGSGFIKSLRPWGDETAPTVELTFDLGNDSWVVAKRFLQRPQITLSGPGGVTFTSDAGEEKLQTLLSFEKASNRGADDESRGVLGLLWVQQGAALSLNAPGRIARETIQSVLASEVGAVTGGKRAAAVITAVEAGYTALRTGKTGAATGALAEAQRQFEAARTVRETAERQLERYGEVLDTLSAARDELKRLERDAADPAQSELDATWRRDLEVAKAAAAKVRETQARLGEATSRREQAEAAVADRTKLQADFTNQDAAVLAAEAAIEVFASTLANAINAEAERAEELTLARTALQKIEAEATKARDAERASARSRALVDAFARLDAAEAIASALEAQRSALKAIVVDDDIYQELVDLDRKVSLASAALEAGSPTLELSFLAGGAEKTRLNGQPAEAGRSVLAHAVEIDVTGIGSFTFAPAETAGLAAETAVRRAREDLIAALARTGLPTLEAARAAATERRETAASVNSLVARLDATCPADLSLGARAGVDALRAALHAVERPGQGSADPAVVAKAAEDAEQALADARVAEHQASGARDSAADGLVAVETEHQRLASVMREASALREHFNKGLVAARTSRLDDVLEQDLRLTRQQEARTSAEAESATQGAAGFSVEELERRLANSDARRRNVEQERVRLAGEIGRLAESARSEGEKGPAGELETALESEASSSARLAAVAEEAETLSLLRSVLAEASREATKLYLGPVTDRVSPYVQRLLPGASLEMSDSMIAGGISRGGRIEPADLLSRGTQEQLAVLTRIAFADLLLEKGQPVSLILDDALVYSDDSRLETMTDIIAEVAQRMQVIVLTCRKRAFMHLDANRLSLRPMAHPQVAG
jgi:energy-coupling factor transporter ATP-binding protein EcfA2